jgi:alginate O-acetyltransferase complex protein AlgI
MPLSSASLLFLFLPLALTVFLVIPPRVRPVWLLIASLVYYAWSARAFVLVLLLAVAVNYALAVLCLSPPAEGRKSPGRRKVALVLALAFNLGLLFASRYGAASASRFAARHAGAIARGIPIGASFFSLALVSYAVDVYRRKIGPERNPLNFALYVTMFAKIVSGPIVRYSDVAGQFARQRITRAGLALGTERFIVGLAKKVLIADVLGAFADEVFSAPVQSLTGGTAWLGALCYTLQIYYDFSGYSDMAIGLGRMFGFAFLENFDHPYVSTSLREFWRRWHISLSTFLRDYLYLPLAYAISRRIRSERVCHVSAEMWAYSLATLATMLLCGLWHRLAWACVLWGLWHGLWLVLENARAGRKLRRRLGGTGRFCVTQWAILMGWVVFRATSLPQAVSLLQIMYGQGRPDAAAIAASARLDRPLALALCLGLAFSAPLVRTARNWGLVHFRSAATGRPWIAALVSYGHAILLLAILLASAMTLAGGTYTPFVYQQF